MTVVHRLLDHARTRDDDIIKVGDLVFYEQDKTSAKVDKIVHNYGGPVLFFNNGVREAAERCWIKKD